MRPNTERKNYIISLMIAVVGVIVVFAPAVLGIEGVDGGYAVSMFGVLVVITGVIAAIIFARRAQMLDAILSGENLLVHWRYSPEEWRRYTEEAHEEERSSKKALFWVISGFAIVIGVAFLIFDPEAGRYVFLVMLGLIAIIAVVAYLTTTLNYRRNRKHLGEAYISRDGVYLNRVLHSWRDVGAGLESVAYDEVSRSLMFTYSAPERTGVRFYTLRVPVPRGQEDTAQWLIAQFSADGTQGP